MIKHLDGGADGLNVVVRFHDIRRLRELDRAIFSLAMQQYRPLQIHLCVQRFSDAEILSMMQRLEPILAIDNAPSLEIHNWVGAEPVDARSVLVNMGIEKSTGRYIAFLDYDDVLYPEAYTFLIDRIRSNSCAIAFGGISLKIFANFEHFDFAESKSFPFCGASLIDLLRANFCPIHSFVIDTRVVGRHLLFFDPLMNRNEDCDFLLRVSSKHVVDFGGIKKVIGEYYIKKDGSNTIMTEFAATPESVQAWKDAEFFVEGRRRTTFVAENVQRSIGIGNPFPELTIRRLLDCYDELLNPILS